tara:strand:+ start:7802 stop:8308 length:507 start_codon:yes stop_codon:yes gene_type:complete
MASVSVRTERAVKAFREMLEWSKGIRDAEYLLDVILDAEDVAGTLNARNETTERKIKKREQHLAKVNGYIVDAEEEAGKVIAACDKKIELKYMSTDIAIKGMDASIIDKTQETSKLIDGLNTEVDGMRDRTNKIAIELKDEGRWRCRYLMENMVCYWHGSRWFGINAC